MIEYKKVKISGRSSILIVCPKCGEEGRLIKHGKRYFVRHEKRMCWIGRMSPYYEEVDAIYQRVRKGVKNEEA